MLNQKEAEKIERYINGLADEKEKAEMESLFLNGKDNYTLRHLLEKDWNQVIRESSSSGVDLNHLLDHIHHLIRKNEHQKRKNLVYMVTRIYIRAAAILLLPLLIAGGLVYSYMSNHFRTTTDQQVSSSIYAPLGARVSFNLPDSTNGMLNSGSSLSYSLPFTNNRHVNLKGEAWFEVSHDEKHPFEINTGNSTVKVLGTSLNVSAYPVENYVEVVLQQGKVDFYFQEGDKKVSLFPSERLVYQNGEISHSVTNPEKYSAWTKGMLVFRGDPMAEVALRIERWYNVKVDLADKELEKYSFRATFEDDKIEEVLRFLSMTSPIRYQITPRQLHADGTYEKEIVTIFLRK